MIIPIIEPAKSAQPGRGSNGTSRIASIRVPTEVNKFKRKYAMAKRTIRKAAVRATLLQILPEPSSAKGSSPTGTIASDCSASVVVFLEAFDCTLNRSNWRITSYAAPAEKYVLAGVNSKLAPLDPIRRTQVGLAISLAMWKKKRSYSSE
ncbi:10276_t:CDS:2 [Paraglomus brasilianum]|uniref:10276_t:CDS:1 n=1 Tax=Paraglomus brasilianum TaxID=144538 RepID=A0A9N8Z7D7_9GLOM|nr:10276_t:CDS:2 [Paraglomus brasilianum]